MPQSIDGSPRSVISPNSSRRAHNGLVETSPSMITRSQCTGECPINSLTGRTARRTRATGGVNHYDHHLHHHDHHYHHHHQDAFQTDSKIGIVKLSDNGTVLKRTADDDSSDEEITLIRRTTNKILTTIETSSRKMNSVHSSCSKYAFLTIFLPILVFLFSWYYYDYSPRVFAYHQQSPQDALLSSVSAASQSHGQPLSSIPFSPGQPSLHSQSYCNLTTSCPSSEEIAILNKRLDRLEQLVFKLTEESSNVTKYIDAVNGKMRMIGTENHKNFASIDKKFNIIAQKIQEAVEINKQVTRSKETASVEEIEGMIKQALYLYDSDKTGKADYALESSGGSIVTSRCSETYDPYGIKYSVWGIPIWYTSNSPRTVIQASMVPGECWAFPGSMGNVTIKLSARIIPTEFSYEHISKEISRDGNIKSAPKAMQIRGLKDENDHEGVLLGNYVYHDNDHPLQHFAVQVNKGRPFNFITLITLSNHGHPDYTCLYRFRVHGHKS